jgi:LuxR family transcriptional regulator, maltose regulon positive regulatory protein
MSVSVSWESPAGTKRNAPRSQPRPPAGAPALPLPAANVGLPVLSPAHVLRPRLTARLDRAPRARVALLVAPPGSGKSSLVSQWCQQCQAAAQGTHQGCPYGLTAQGSEPTPPEPSTGRGTPGGCPLLPPPAVAWLSLDTAENDPARFLLSLCAALESVAPEAAARVCSLLQSPPECSLQSALTLLLNGLGALSQGVTLVLDDYHAIEARAVHDLVAFLIEYLPPNLFLILIARSDPPLPLARLRRQGQIIEIRDADLRFNHEEATRFLNECMGLSLAPEAVARLVERTEGWIAGLQMAAFSLQGETDPNGFLDAFTGSNRYLLEFLFENVLQRQPPEVQSFLGQTAFLDRLCGPLCEAVTGMRGGQAMLERLEEANLFLAPLDRERRWYRYQPFLASALRAWSLSQGWRAVGGAA